MPPKFNIGDRVIVTEDNMRLYDLRRGDFATVDEESYVPFVVPDRFRNALYRRVAVGESFLMSFADWEKLSELERLLF